jgi:ribonucleotide monophosphatase NagD (HAD superfamily)
MDMDGVFVREDNPIPGAGEFIARLRSLGIPFLVLTNNSIYTPRMRSGHLPWRRRAFWTISAPPVRRS